MARAAAAFDANDATALDRFFDELPEPIDHVMVTAGGPHYARLADIDVTRARRALAVHVMTNTALTGATYDVDGGQQLVTAG